jgi:hypothetical protein
MRRGGADECVSRHIAERETSINDDGTYYDPEKSYVELKLRRPSPSRCP